MLRGGIDFRDLMVQHRARVSDLLQQRQGKLLATTMVFTHVSFHRSSRRPRQRRRNRSSTVCGVVAFRLLASANGLIFPSVYKRLKIFIRDTMNSSVPVSDSHGKDVCQIAMKLPSVLLKQNP